MISEKILLERKRNAELLIGKLKDRGKTNPNPKRIEEEEATLKGIEDALKAFDAPKKPYLDKNAITNPVVKKDEQKRKRKLKAKKDLFTLK